MEAVRQTPEKGEPVCGNIQFPASGTLAIALIVLGIKSEKRGLRILLHLPDEPFKHRIFRSGTVPAELFHRPFSHHLGEPFGMRVEEFPVIQTDIVSGTVNVESLHPAGGKRFSSPLNTVADDVAEITRQPGLQMRIRAVQEVITAIGDARLAADGQFRKGKRRPVPFRPDRREEGIRPETFPFRMLY